MAGNDRVNYRYTRLPKTISRRVEYGPFVLEEHPDGSKLRLPCKRPQLDAAIADLLTEYDVLLAQYEALSEGRPLVVYNRRPELRHGVFDVKSTGERQVWSQGGLDKRVPKARLRPTAPPWGHYPDIEE